MKSHSTIYSLDYDINGNKICRVKVYGCRAFSIQTNGNMPKTDHGGFSESYTPGEVSSYIRQFGTDKQKAAIGV